ncbi:TIM barrel protein [Oceanispirochaeta sp.]|jgi:sugar phosphate isomerase/epimerase|uniref:sugar phosphate isomerase/epimerase family protein n=1 Tax=Oceanispirochaeta sp. TaxID=2035350 RepID=UPI00260888EF|nr:TIM barrel protein [Oceanispirochaeta sp.]MDA3958365.1 TIM barrel protein [Oceanispirochaeta sp.]
MNLIYTGISDEGAPGLKEQINLHRQLGWNSLELRSIDGKNICEMPDRDFDEAFEIISEEGFSVAGFGSSIANWSRPVTGDFNIDKQDLMRAAPRMHKLKTPFLRIMSYTQGEASDQEWAEKAISRVLELTRMAEGEGITLIHENCDGWASSKPENMARMLDAIPSKALKIVFDMGNPRSHGHPEEAVFDFLKVCKERIVHIHIKDCYLNEKNEDIHCFPGEGECHVYDIVETMVKEQNFRGYISIEPHMVFQFHKNREKNGEADTKKAANYLAYGRKTMALLSGLEKE